MDDNEQASQDTGDRSAKGPTVHVAPSGTLYVELADLVPYFLPTEEEVRGYIKGGSENYIKEARANIARGQQGSIS